MSVVWAVFEIEENKLVVSHSRSVNNRSVPPNDQLRFYIVRVPLPMHVAIESPDQPEVIELIAELDAYQRSLYPPESTHLLDLASLKQANVLFVVA